MKFLTFSAVFLLYAVSLVSAQSNDQTFNYEFLPEGLHFQPLKAHIKEPRMGVLYNPSNGQLKLDIGNSVDLLKFQISDNEKLTFGIEFNAYAHSINYQEKRLQIDAIDGFFGGNAVFSSANESSGFLTRFRIIHNSAHFVDGHYDKETNSWKEDLEPIPFTRDFGELLFAYQLNFEKSSLKLYSGPVYATLVRPMEIKKWSLDAGIEYYITNLIGRLFHKDENLFIAHHFELFGAPVYQGNNNFVIGMKLGKWEAKGVTVYLNYYNGKNLFNEYYKMRVKKFGMGFSIDFP